MAAPIHIRLIGTLRIEAEAGSGPVNEARLGPLGRLALAYLAVERHRPVARDELADVLWGEHPPPTWTAALRGVIGRVRGVLAAAGLSEDDVVTSEAGCYRLHLPETTVLDVEAADRALHVARAALATGDTPLAVDAASEAVSLTGGQFLAGATGAWVERRQAEVAELHQAALEALSEAACASGDAAMALKAAEEAVADQPFRESAHLRLMAAHAAAGNRAEALRAYERCRHALAEALGVSPSAATEAAYLRLLEDAPAPAPPAAADPTPPTTGRLPTSVTSFIGRDAEVADVKAQLGSSRLVTLLGTGGVGKSRLALRVAADVAADQPDGVWLVELAGLSDPALVPQQVLSALGAVEAPRRSITDSLISHLASRRLLLLLDNCEHLVAACATLVDSLLPGCPRLSILATSREALRVPGEVTWTVPPLTGGEGVRLFAERARVVAPDFELSEPVARSAALICDRLDGIPLAIELAAARTRVLSVPDIAERLGDRFGFLVGGPRTAPTRHQTLRATLDWSHESLSPAEAVLFRQLSVFAGGFTLEAAEAVAEMADGALEALAGLVDKSLVLVDRSSAATRFRMLETVRQYAAEQLVASGEQQVVRDRHLAWALAWAESAESELEGGEQQAWLDALDADHDNLRAALDWAGEARTDLAGVRLAGSLWRFWEIRGYLAEGRSRLAAWASRDEVPDRLRAKIRNSAGILAQRQRDFEASRRYYQAALDIRRTHGDRVGMATSVHGLANIALQDNDLETARPLLEENLALARELGEHRMVAASLMNLGVVEQLNYMSGRVTTNEGAPRARAYYQESLVEYRALGDGYGMALALENLGSIAPHQGLYDEARAYHEESMAIRRRLGDKLGIAASARFLGALALRSGDSGLARGLHEEYLAIERELGRPPHQAEAAAFLAEVAVIEGDYAEARRLLEEGVAIQRGEDDSRRLCWMLRSLAEVMFRQGDLDAARAGFEEVVVMARETGAHWDQSRALGFLAQVARSEGDMTTVAERCRQALAVPGGSQNDRIVALLTQSLAGVALHAGRWEVAASLLGAADNIGARLDPPEPGPGPPEQEADRAEVRDRLGEAAFEAALSDGADLPRKLLVELLHEVAAEAPG